MRLLLDTHVLVWAMARPDRLARDVKLALSSRDNEIFVSAASVWEAAIKFALRRPDFPVPPQELVGYATEMEFEQLPVVAAAAARVATLPLHHRDPFDRLLVAQAIEAEAQLLTADAALAAYAPHVLLTV